MCGGKGTRLKEETDFRPKPMVEIGGKPILWHILKIYAHQGYNNFILCLGYKGAMIKEYFLNHKLFTKDFHLDVSQNNHLILDNNNDDDFKITFADTGQDTLTAERLQIASKYIPGDEFMMTYGDGVSDIDLKKLHQFHRQMKESHGVIGTVTGVHPKSKSGLVNCDDNCLITHFEEKPRLFDYVNGGFMVLNKEFLSYCKPNQMVEYSLIDASKDRKIALHKYDGFWHCMDTYKDKEDLEKMWVEDPKWKVWA